MTKIFTNCVLHELGAGELAKKIKESKAEIPIYELESEFEVKETFLEENLWQDIRRKKALACADVVVGGWRKGEFVIAASLRGGNESYPDTYAMVGGNMVSSIDSVESFLKEKIEKETKVQADENTKLHYIGTYITQCPKTGIMTMQVCFFSLAGEEWLEAFLNQKERSQESLEYKLFSKNEWRKVPKEKKFWYQDRVFNLIWDAMEVSGLQE